MMMNIMEVFENEDTKREATRKVPFIDQAFWKGTLEGMIDLRTKQFPILNICDECTRDCKQVEVAGLLRFFCGIRGLEWKK